MFANRSIIMVAQFDFHAVYRQCFLTNRQFEVFGPKGEAERCPRSGTERRVTVCSSLRSGERVRSRLGFDALS